MQKTLSHLLKQTLHSSKLLIFLGLGLTLIPACNQSIDSISPRPSQSASTTVATQTTQNQISVSLAPDRRSIAPGLMCFNVNAVRVQSWKNPDFIAAVKRLSPQGIRIPGGEGSSYWDWKRGGLKQDLQGLPDGLPQFLRYRDREYIDSKLEDFKAGFKATGTTPLYVLNMLSSTLDSQIEMLKEAQRLGMPVREIELGNEFYFATKNYRAVFPKPEDYAQTASAWTIKIKQIFPQARVSVIGVENQGYKKGARRRNWNRLVLPVALKNADAATVHVYTEHGLEKEIKTANTQYPFFEAQDVPIILGEPFRHWKKLKKGDGFRWVPKHKKIWITEYNLFEKIFNQNRGNKPKVVGSWAHGLHTLSMSLLFLEDERVEKICNHMLVGNSMFAAIYANENSFIDPSNPTAISTPFGLSTTGSSLQLLGKALNQATVAQKMDFSGNPRLTGKEQFDYPALYGWVFADAQGRKRGIVLNLSDQPLTSDLTQIFPANTSFSQLSGSPRALVTGPGVLDKKAGQTSGLLTLPAYSTTLLVDP